MTGRRYGQYCGLAKALEIVGERWGLLVVRDLVLGAKSFSQLRESLRGVPASILSSRLNELEAGAVVRRRVTGDLDAVVTYELTEYGHDLEDAIYRLALWGARSLGERAPDEVHTPDAAVLALRTLFRPDGGAPVVYVLDYGFTVVTARVGPTGALIDHGRASDPDLTIVLRGSPRPLFTGAMTPADAIRAGLLVASGSPSALDRFPALFSIPAAPSPVVPLVGTPA